MSGSAQAAPDDHKEALFKHHLGPVWDLFMDDDVTEVMVARGRVYVERKGRLQRVPHGGYESDAHLRDAIVAFGNSIGRTVNAQHPVVDARLRNGARLCGVLDPVSVGCCAMTLRPLRAIAFAADDLIERRMLSAGMAGWLQCAVKLGSNVVVSGGTGSGKTTLLRALTAQIPSEDRVLVVEDTCERLVPEHEHIVELETVKRAPGEDGEAIDMQRLVEVAMRSRPDRIIVGEIRNGEAAEAFVEALNTGHGGTLTTTHANGGWETLQRVSMLHARATPHVPYEVLQRLVALAIDVVVNVGREAIGGEKRRVVREVGVVTRDGEVAPVFTVRPDGTWKHHVENDDLTRPGDDA